MGRAQTGPELADLHLNVNKLCALSKRNFIAIYRWVMVLEILLIIEE